MSIMVCLNGLHAIEQTYLSGLGNGIQKAFYDDPNVLYISIHVHQNGRFYPGGDEGDWDHCGAGPGVGR